MDDLILPLTILYQIEPFILEKSCAVDHGEREDCAADTLSECRNNGCCWAGRTAEMRCYHKA